MAVKARSTKHQARTESGFGFRISDFGFQAKRGIALLVTLIFMSVMLSFGLALAALAYKQSILTSNATRSQQAFFAADGALECALYADQQLGAFVYAEHSAANLPDRTIIPKACDGVEANPDPVYVNTYTSSRLTLSERISFNGGASCADITVYKYANPIPLIPPAPPGSKQWRSFVYSTGYNVPCSAVASASAGGRIVVRGLFQRF